MTPPRRIVARGIRCTARAAGAVAERLGHGMTPGRRWTAALALALSVLMVLFGSPVRVVVRSRTARAAPQRPELQVPFVQPVAPAQFGVPPAPAPTDSGPRGVVGPIPPPLFTEIPSLVAIVRPGGSQVPGHDEESVARAFLGRTGVATVTTIILDPAVADLCARVLAAGKLVLAGEGLPITLRSCLVQGGATVLAFDADGDVPQAGGSGQVVSTRRGIEDSLADLGAWGKRNGALAGKVGVVGVRSTAFATDAAIERLRAIGIDVAERVYFDGTSPTEVPDGVRSFATAEIQVVLFAAPMDVQRRWVAQAAILGPPFRYVVSDSHDAIVDETYPAVFDGTLAHTSIRVPWFARTHAETSVQAACRTAWETVAVPPRTLDTDELVSVFIWCQHANLVLAATRATEDGTPFELALRKQHVVSPLTSDVGPLSAGGFGPTQDAVLVWRASCSCWMESRVFAFRES